ncbi:hypothetical protein DM02DRAFT_612254 [Periconia macrospinosa]|uniref:F-box domain-containing protein n=1 Tax=Periconia macrospinosa TaxID=97972 RepID=A0A2V1E1L0_9PLEO|nr:hypothetical protein DM02DRAFT_612254 [Periconia macrospinosa]
MERSPELAECISPTSWPTAGQSVILATKSSSTEPSSATLITIPYEILESILLYLPMKDLLLCQRVCQCFKQVVVSSKSIQRALFLKPSHSPQRFVEWEPMRWNPLFEEKLASSFVIRILAINRTEEGLVKMIAQVRLREDIFSNRSWSDILLRDDASWKSILITQPPATMLLHPGASLFWKTSMESWAQSFQNSAGFKISEIVMGVTGKKNSTLVL